MREKEYKLILDRAKHEADVKQYFSKHLDLLIDLANYGSNLVPRAHDSSKKKLEDHIVIGVLLKQVVAMIDAIEILISKGAVDPANLQARSAFEASLYIEWFLEGESEKKAKYYYVSNLRNQRLWALRFKTGTKEKEIFAESIRGLEKYIKTADLDDVERLANEQITEIDKVLAKPEWYEINREFEDRRIKKTGVEVYWYKLLGIPSIRRLAKEVGRLGEYDMFYSRSSEVMHTASYKDHLQFENGTVSFEPVRQLRDIQIILRFITVTAISSFKSILSYYRYGELGSFKRKYMLDWRDAFLNIPSVSYTRQTDRLGIP